MLTCTVHCNLDVCRQSTFATQRPRQRGCMYVTAHVKPGTMTHLAKHVLVRQLEISMLFHSGQSSLEVAHTVAQHLCHTHAPVLLPLPTFCPSPTKHAGHLTLSSNNTINSKRGDIEGVHCLGLYYSTSLSHSAAKCNKKTHLPNVVLKSPRISPHTRTR